MPTFIINNKKYNIPDEIIHNVMQYFSLESIDRENFGRTNKSVQKTKRLLDEQERSSLLISNGAKVLDDITMDIPYYSMEINFILIDGFATVLDDSLENVNEDKLRCIADYANMHLENTTKIIKQLCQFNSLLLEKILDKYLTLDVQPEGNQINRRNFLNNSLGGRVLISV